jgi:glutathione S-transferase
MHRREIVLHYSRASRSFTTLWMLEELALPYRLVDRDLRSHKNRAPDYLELNPMGQVPTLQIGDVVISENPAICIYLADRFSYGALAPYIEHPDRGPWLKWLVFATSTLEPAMALMGARVDPGPAGPPAWGLAWDSHREVVDALVQALDGREHVVGPTFTAADVMLGSAIAMRLHVGELPRARALVAYAERLSRRPAFRRAAAVTWGQAADA